MSFLRALGAAALGVALCAAPAAAAPFTFDFTQDWNGGVFSGTFTGEDLDLDGYLASFSGEITGFSGTLTGASAAPDLSFDLSALWGLVYRLGTGVIGDDPTGGTEGLGVGDTTAGYDLQVGLGPLSAPCDGVLLCGEIFDIGGSVEQTTGQLFVTNDPNPAPADVPLPAGAALLLSGLAALGLKRRA